VTVNLLIAKGMFGDQDYISLSSNPGPKHQVACVEFRLPKQEFVPRVDGIALFPPTIRCSSSLRACPKELSHAKQKVKEGIGAEGGDSISARQLSSYN
jgi:hypothetical protein